MECTWHCQLFSPVFCIKMKETDDLFFAPLNENLLYWQQCICISFAYSLLTIYTHTHTHTHSHVLVYSYLMFNEFELNWIELGWGVWDIPSRPHLHIEWQTEIDMINIIPGIGPNETSGPRDAHVRNEINFNWIRCKWCCNGVCCVI